MKLWRWRGGWGVEGGGTDVDRDLVRNAHVITAWQVQGREGRELQIEIYLLT